METVDKRHEEHMEQFKHGWDEKQVECINTYINLHREHLNELCKLWKERTGESKC